MKEPDTSAQLREFAKQLRKLPYGWIELEACMLEGQAKGIDRRTKGYKQMRASDIEILKYCEPHLQFMWAAQILSLIHTPSPRDGLLSRMPSSA